MVDNREILDMNIADCRVIQRMLEDINLTDMTSSGDNLTHSPSLFGLEIAMSRW